MHGFEYVEFVHGAGDVTPVGCPDTTGPWRAGGASRTSCASGSSAAAGGAGLARAPKAEHRVEESRLLIALKENPKPSKGALAADPAPRLLSRSVRTPTAPIYAPDFPPDIEWLNAPFVRLGTLLGRHVPLVWFWDYTSLNSIRALPYLQEWHRRYADAGLSVIGVHSPQFGFGQGPQNVSAAVERLEIEFPVALDSDFETWKLYGNEVWPSLYLWDRRGVLRHYHHAEGGYLETEEAIQELLGEIDDRLRDARSR